VPLRAGKMQLQYEGVVEEHRAVREPLRVFDISHMGVLTSKAMG